MTSRLALSSYRSLLRARSIAFKSDARALQESKTAIRTEFVKHKLVSDKDELSELFAGCREVEHMLKTGIIQGEIEQDKETNKTKVKVEIRPEQTEKMANEVNEIEHLGDAGEEKDIDELVVTKSGSK